MVRVLSPQQSREHSEEGESTNTNRGNQQVHMSWVRADVCRITWSAGGCGFASKTPWAFAKSLSQAPVPIMASLQKEIEIEGSLAMYMF